MTDTQTTTETAQTHPYEPEPRLVDDPERLKELYHTYELSIREIADNHTEMSHAAVFQAIKKYGLQKQSSEPNTTHTNTPEQSSVNWKQLG